jgi:hypothetical protein
VRNKIGRAILLSAVALLTLGFLRAMANDPIRIQEAAEKDGVLICLACLRQPADDGEGNPRNPLKIEYLSPQGTVMPDALGICDTCQPTQETRGKVKKNWLAYRIFRANEQHRLQGGPGGRYTRADLGRTIKGFQAVRFTDDEVETAKAGN